MRQRVCSSTKEKRHWYEVMMSAFDHGCHEVKGTEQKKTMMMNFIFLLAQRTID
jgi:hypothetical protein